MSEPSRVGPPLIWHAEERDRATLSTAEWLAPWAAGAVLVALYEHGISFRIETDHYVGFTWTWVRHDVARAPRVLMDHLLSGGEVIQQSSRAASASDAGQFLAPDWYERGSGATLEAAAEALAKAVVRLFPDGEFCCWLTKFQEDLVKAEKF